jgi:hypothetical protein
MNYRFGPTSICILLLSTLVFAKDVTIRGFVTAVNSPSSFQIDDYRIAAEKVLSLEFGDRQDNTPIPAFTPKDIRIGTELEITGEYDDNSRELKARSIRVFFYDTLTVKRTALLEKVPRLTKSDSGWTGVISADGERIAISPTTAVTLKPSRAERKSALLHDTSEALKFTPEALNLDTFVHYEGVRQSDGSIKAQNVEFERSEIENGEARMRQRFAPAVINPDYASNEAGVIEMYRKEYKILPSQEVQEYISRLGNSLVPVHQKELADNDPLKIPFRFFLVEKEGFNALTYPNGVVIVYSGAFDVLENEAELAFALAHEISHAVERHVWQQQEYFRNELIALKQRGVFVPDRLLLANLRASSFSSNYARSLENQADRVGLEWMLAAGYDVREAPQSWAAVARKMSDPASNPYWSSRENFTARRSYLMAELRNRYADVNYSNLKKDSDEFHRVAKIIQEFQKNKVPRAATAAAGK